MKIVVIVDDVKGGAGNVAQQLSMSFANSGHEVYLLFWNITVESRYDLSNIKVCNLYLNKFDNQNSLCAFIKRINVYKKTINQIQPDAIISFLEIINVHVLISQIFSSIPIIVSERTNPFAYKLSKHWNILRNYLYKIRANKITVLFDEFKFFFSQELQHKIITIPNYFQVPTVQKQSYKLTTNRIRFVSIARLTEVKRFDLMINLFEKIYQHNHNVELNIFGSGPEYNYLLDLISKKKLQEVVFLKGYCKYVSEELAHSDVYLMTSKYEGFPNSLCEAMACGLPTVSICTHNGLNEIIYNKENGFLIPENDYNSFIDTCLLLAENEELRKTMGTKAKSILKSYSYENIIAIWNDTINGLINIKV